MLFKLNLKEKTITKVSRTRLKEINWNENDLQKLLFKNLTLVIEEEELLVISQSRKWQEEPDIMAIDKNGDLWIFEIKRWESEPSNLLQVLRYGQIFGQQDYEDLNNLFINLDKGELIKVHNKIFPENKLNTSDFNINQHFVIMTNGVDVKTRQAISYWKNKGLDVRPWIYRIYRPSESKSDIFLEFNKLRTVDDPFEDIEEGYFIVNTNYSNTPSCDESMMNEKKAAAYYSPWKYSITRIQKGDKVFLYRSGTGIVARGIAKDRYKMKDYEGDKNEEYFVELSNFQKLVKPLKASEIVELTEVDYRFMKTCFAIPKESGDIIWKTISERVKETE